MDSITPRGLAQSAGLEQITSTALHCRKRLNTAPPHQCRIVKFAHDFKERLKQSAGIQIRLRQTAEREERRLNGRKARRGFTANARESIVTMRTHTRRFFRGPSGEIREGESSELSGLIQNVFDEGLFIELIECFALRCAALTSPAAPRTRPSEKMSPLCVLIWPVASYMASSASSPMSLSTASRNAGSSAIHSPAAKNRGKKDEIAAALLWNVKKSMSSWEPECAGSTKPGLGWSPTS